VTKVKDVFNTLTSFDIENGKMTLFWQDTWLGSPIKYRYPELYNGIAQKNCTVIDMYVGGQWVIEQITNESQLAQLQRNQLNEELNYIRLQNQIRDEINWTIVGKDFTVRSLYHFLQDFPNIKFELKNI
jgi:hypothetical protein